MEIIPEENEGGRTNQNKMPKVDNYIRFLNAFHEWKKSHPMTHTQLWLMMEILHKANAAGWAEWVKIPTGQLMVDANITNPVTFRNNRDRLINLGLIQYKSGKKGTPGSYKLQMPTKKEVFYSFGKNKVVKNDGYEINHKINQKINHKINQKINHKINQKIDHKINQKIDHKINQNSDALILNNINNKTKESISNEILKKNEFSLSLRGGECENENFEAEQATPSEKAPRHSGITEKCRKMADLYCEICKDLPQAVKLSDKRKRQIIRLFELGYSEEDFKKVFENAQKSSFLCGRTATGFRANLDWLVSENNFLKVLEGNYLDVVQKPANPRKFIETSMNVEDWI